MNATEKKLQYQGIQKLGQLERAGAKPATIERMKRSLAGDRRPVQKGKVYSGKRTR